MFLLNLNYKLAGIEIMKQEMLTAEELLEAMVIEKDLMHASIGYTLVGDEAAAWSQQVPRKWQARGYH